VSRNYKRWSDDEKEHALKLVDKFGVEKTSRKLGIASSTIHYWKSQRNKKEVKKTSMIIQPIDPNKELKDNPNITFQSQGADRQFKRGEIYYVSQRPSVGVEMVAGRPAVIVSNDRLNENLSCVEVVYLTTKTKCIAPEHISIRSSGVLATTICEQITTIDKSRIREFVGECTPIEMKLINKALLYSLGLGEYVKETMGDDEIVARISSVVAERNAYQELTERLLDRLMEKKK